MIKKRSKIMPSSKATGLMTLMIIVGAEMLLPNGDDMFHGKVIKRAKGEVGIPIRRRILEKIKSTCRIARWLRSRVYGEH